MSSDSLSFFNFSIVKQSSSISPSFNLNKLSLIAKNTVNSVIITNTQREIEWVNEAFTKIASHLNALESPNEAAFYTSGRTSNEASFLYQLFAKEFGTNNMPDCSNMCHETSGTALKTTIGIGKGTVTLEDFYDTDVIIIVLVGDRNNDKYYKVFY